MHYSVGLPIDQEVDPALVFRERRIGSWFLLSSDGLRPSILVPYGITHILLLTLLAVVHDPGNYLIYRLNSHRSLWPRLWSRSNSHMWL